MHPIVCGLSFSYIMVDIGLLGLETYDKVPICGSFTMCGNVNQIAIK